MLTYTKKKLADLERCYSATAFSIQGQLNLVCASEGHFPCYRFYGEDFLMRETVWEEPGGTMSVIPVPGVQDAFLAIQRFFRLYQWEEAQIVWVQREADGQFASHPVFASPYIHRFDLMEKNGVCYFVGCTLSGKKETREDWLVPGAVYTAVLNRQTQTLEQLQCLRDDVYKNHGYWHEEAEDGCYGLFGCEQGIWKLTPPDRPGAPWGQEKIFDGPASDMALCDIDGDGLQEMAVIAPFHGEYFRIYKPSEAGWKLVYQNPEVTPFYHAVIAGKIGATPVFFGGCRRGKQQLFAVTWDPEKGQYDTHVLDEGAGPSNLALVNLSERDVLLSANREKGEIATYIFER